MSTDEHQTPVEMMERLRILLAEAAHLARQLPAALLPGAIEYSLIAPLTTLLLALNERGVAPNVQKDRIAVQSEVKAVRDTISDVLDMIIDQGDQRGLLDPARRAELIEVIKEQSEVYPLVSRGSISQAQIEMWVARKLAQRKSS
jgi:hypothetical protein